MSGIGKDLIKSDWTQSSFGNHPWEQYLVNLAAGVLSAKPSDRNHHCALHKDHLLLFFFQFRLFILHLNHKLSSLLFYSLPPFPLCPPSSIFPSSVLAQKGQNSYGHQQNMAYRAAIRLSTPHTVFRLCNQPSMRKRFPGANQSTKDSPALIAWSHTNRPSYTTVIYMQRA